MFKYRFLIIVLVIFMFNSFGCESFRRKFIRKPKDKPKTEDMVIVPKDYSKLQIPVDEAYVQYYTYWKSWHNELLTYLIEGTSKKKIISCFEQTILNLDRMRDLLESEEKISLLDSYIIEVSSLAEEIEVKTIAMITTGRIKNQSMQLLRNIQRDFALSKVKDYLKW